MIRCTNIKHWHKADYDRTFLIVRSIASLERTHSSILNDAMHVPDLSPSCNLFWSYLGWKKQGCWNQETFDNVYKPAFINEIKNNETAKEWLNRLEQYDKAGENIALLCFCVDENLCHRIIIGEMLKQRGCNVMFDCDTITEEG